MRGIILHMVARRELRRMQYLGFGRWDVSFD